MSSYSILHGSTSNFGCSTCSKILYYWEMQQLRDAAEYPCSPECKIVEHILLDHSLSYALTTTADVPTVYLQQFWRTVSKVPGPKDMFKFMLNTREFIYTVDMFQDILHLPVKTPENPYVAPVNIETIEAFMNSVGYQGVVDKKEAIQYPRFIKLIIADLMKKFPDIPQRIEECYHSIKDNILLSLGEEDEAKCWRIQFTKKITQNNHQERETKYTSIPPPSDDRERDEIAEATLLKEEIEKMVEGEKDEESYASEFADSILNDDVDDSEKNDEEIEKDKKDKEIEKEKKDDTIEKTDEVVKEKDIVGDLTS
ncbi:hypothetical protein Tco_1290309, partial [Tanacetum coccineum]